MDELRKKSYSVSADTDSAPLDSGVIDYGHAKFLYDRWRQDPEVFNIQMYFYVNGNKIPVEVPDTF